MTSMPGMDLGRSASVAGSVSASLRHGIWMMSFVNDGLTVRTGNLRNYGYSAGFSNQPTSVSTTPSQVIRARDLVAGVAERRGARADRPQTVDRVGERLRRRLADEAVGAVDARTRSARRNRCR